MAEDITGLQPFEYEVAGEQSVIRVKELVLVNQNQHRRHDQERRNHQITQDVLPLAPLIQKHDRCHTAKDGIQKIAAMHQARRS